MTLRKSEHALDISFTKGLKTNIFAALEAASIRVNMGAEMMLQEAKCKAKAS